MPDPILDEMRNLPRGIPGSQRDYSRTPTHEEMERDGPQTVDERLIRLEAKLDALILALKAGAIGQWGNDR